MIKLNHDDSARMIALQNEVRGATAKLFDGDLSRFDEQIVNTATGIFEIERRAKSAVADIIETHLNLCSATDLLSELTPEQRTAAQQAMQVIGGIPEFMRKQ